MDKIKEFFEGVQKEMKKVTWPSQKELIDNTIVVVIFSIILAIFIFGVDQAYSTVLEFLYK
ncbi:MAG TPA: preprotein translocase subunit SecE [Balneolales bacterium]|nr:preprotein translocase subunit SecE [Balneolales bacterium]